MSTIGVTPLIQARLETLINDAYRSGTDYVTNNDGGVDRLNEFLSDINNLMGVDFDKQVNGKDIMDHVYVITQAPIGIKSMSKAVIMLYKQAYYEKAERNKNYLLNAAAAEGDAKMVNELLTRDTVLRELRSEVSSNKGSNVLISAVEGGSLAVFRRLMEVPCIRDELNNPKSGFAIDVLVAAINKSNKGIFSELIALDNTKKRITQCSSTALTRAFMTHEKNKKSAESASILASVQQLCDEYEAMPDSSKFEVPAVTKPATATATSSTTLAPTSSVSSTSTASTANLTLTRKKLTEHYNQFFFENPIHGMNGKVETATKE